jgi:thioredoxin reductase
MSQVTERPAHEYDVAVIGGGAAGLSAAVVLGRARRSVIVVDAGAPRNAAATGVHSFLTRDGMPPAELIAAGQAEVARYGGVTRHGTARSARRGDNGFEVTLDDGTAIAARQLLVTSGLTDELPDVPGVAELWGRDVVHCPYCHGWEVRDQAIGVLGSGPMAVHQALLFRQWTPDLVLFVHTAPEPTPEQAEQLAARGIRVLAGRVDRLEVADGRLTGVRLRDGTVIARQAVVAGPRMAAWSPVLGSLGLEPAAHPLGAAVGESYPADPTGLTAVPGVWVAGNVTDVQAQVISAAAQGVLTAAAINGALIVAETAAAVEAARREQLPAAAVSG